MRTLKELLLNVNCDKNTVDEKIKIKGIKHNCNEIKKDELFVCLKKGTQAADNIKTALNNGAAAVIAEKIPEENIPFIKVKNIRKAYALIAENFFGNPAENLKITAVVGTNGKTTVSHLLNFVLKDNGIKTGLIGTIGNEICGKFKSAQLTTPDPMEFNELLYDMKKEGAEIVITELSAHAIFFNKLYGIKCDYGIFTNFTQDHLDFFKTMEKYKKVKCSFFKPESVKFCVINNDDETGREIVSLCKLPYLTYGIFSPSDCFAMDIRYTEEGSEFLVNAMDELYDVKSKLYGEFNIYNILAVISTARAMGLKLENIIKSIEKFPFVNGRFNVFTFNGVKFIVDYAHTPDGLKNLLGAARRITEKKLIAVFGCGGDRDKSKRPIMGKIAEELADKIILTSDNPRNENADEIINQIKSGIIDKKYKTVTDRTSAILEAYEEASSGDVIVIAGKGAEEYMEISGKKIPYSDLETVRNLIENRI